MKSKIPMRAVRRLLLAAALLPGLTFAQGPRVPGFDPAEQRPAEGQVADARAGAQHRLFEEKVGSFPVRGGMRLKLATDLGNIRVRTQEGPELRYRVRVETLASDPEAARRLKQFAFSARLVPEGVNLTAQVPWGEFRGRLWVNFEIAVPHNFSLDLQTQAGNVEMDSVGGRVNIFTAGGNVQAERIGGAAHIETRGGHITVQDVGSDLTALTQGGHISIGNVRGDATVRTGGGHVRVASVQGVAQLESGGGNIYLEKAGANVTANTLGGRIDFGEASGGIRARTGGGSIGVLRVAGPTEIESSGGSISLTSVQGSIRASTASGPITAWFVAAGQDGKLKGPWQLESGQGDIVVFIPRAMALTVDATIESPAENRIEADQELPMKVSYSTSAGRRPMHGKAVLNGGGDLLRLRTGSGNIRLRYIDAPGQAYEQQAIEQVRRNLEIQRRMLEQQLQRQKQLIEREVEQKLSETKRELSRLDLWGRKLQFMWSGSVRVPEPEQRRKLVYSLRPVYPAQAREQRVQGIVRLELMISPEGKVESTKVVQGHPLLVPAAMNAVKQWRYSPTLLDGKPIPVVTSVDIAFKLD